MNTSTIPLGPVMLDLIGLQLAQDEAELLRNPMVGGVILFSRNYAGPGQLRELVQQVRAERPDLVIAVDQEGGRVQRFREGFTRIPPMQLLGRQCERAEAEGMALARDCGWLMATELLSTGVDMSFAPVLDIDDTYSRVIGDRSFGPRAETVIIAARAFMQGMHEAGMATTGKHFPGHGSVVADSHLELPIDTRTFEEIDSHDLRPFRELVGELNAVMPAHLLVPAVDDRPVGFSHTWLQRVLRGELRFDGVIFSDDLSMAGAASAGNLPERALTALDAGCDVALVCNNQQHAIAVLTHLQREKRAGSGRLCRMRSQTSAAAAAQASVGERADNVRVRLTQLEKQTL